MITISGSSRDEFIFGSRRRETIYDLGGNDTVYGGGRADIFVNTSGNDILHGQGGDDIFHLSPFGDEPRSVKIFGGTGDDTFDLYTALDYTIEERGRLTVIEFYDNDSMFDGKIVLRGVEHVDVTQTGADFAV